MALSEQDVRRALEELGRMRFEAADLGEAMKDIVHTTHSIFSVDGAGLMLIDPPQLLRVAAASDGRLAHLEELELAHHEGPCVEAHEERQVVQCDDLAATDRWPAFAPAAVAWGIRAVLASPIPFQQQPVGVMAVVTRTARPWTPQGELALVAFTDLVALLLATTVYAEEQSELATRLRDAIDARQLVARAAAAVAEQEGVSLRAGHQRLKATARGEHRPLAEVAVDVLAGHRRYSPPGAAGRTPDGTG